MPEERQFRLRLFLRSAAPLVVVALDAVRPATAEERAEAMKFSEKWPGLVLGKIDN
jgi:hypothetical protein